jgi:hypothetical protein
MPTDLTRSFYVVAKEPGAEHPAIPTWASETINAANFGFDIPANMQRIEVEAVPGAFQLLNLISESECRQLIDITESLGYLQDAAVSLPRSVRHNHNVTWVVDEKTTDIIWQRCAPLISDDEAYLSGKKALGVNARFRFYRYRPGDYFKPHTDGSWPGSKVADKKLVTNSYPDRWSQLSFLLFLSDEFEGGSTQFYVSQAHPSRPARNLEQATVVNVRTPMGAALCFPHGAHPQHCLHSSEEIKSGTKYIIRSDVLFEI